MRRREFIKVVAGSAVWSAWANAQSSNKPSIGFLSARSAGESAHLVDAFRKGLAEYNLIEGQNVAIEYRWQIVSTNVCPLTPPIFWQGSPRCSSLSGET